MLLAHIESICQSNAPDIAVNMDVADACVSMVNRASWANVERCPAENRRRSLRSSANSSANLSMAANSRAFTLSPSRSMASGTAAIVSFEPVSVVPGVRECDSID